MSIPPSSDRLKRGGSKDQARKLFGWLFRKPSLSNGAEMASSLRPTAKEEEPNNRYQTPLEIVLSYVPRSIVHRFNTRCEPLVDPEVEQFSATILFIDISGFTALNERLSQLDGGEGPEMVTKHLNAYFGELIKKVHLHGGDVLKFAGDALICQFGEQVHEPQSPSQQLQQQRKRRLKTVTLEAVDCAFEIQNTLSRYDCNGVTLTLHIAVGTGEVYSLHVGGVDGFWEYLIAGEPFLQLKSAVEDSASGEVVVSQKTWDIVKSYFKGKSRGKNWLVTSKSKPLPLQSGTGIPPIDIMSLPLNIEKVVVGYVGRGLASFLNHASNHASGGWIYDFIDDLRTCTVLFVSLPSLIYNPKGNNKLDTESIHSSLCIMQSVIFALEGVIRQFLVDDKGTVLVAAFGLPPFYHEDDPVRGAQAALRIQAALTKIGIQSSIGVTTGKVFCGTVGNSERREYAMVGDIVNLSARLMVAASGGVLCDKATYLGANNRLKFESRPPIMVKGKEHEVQIFRPQETTNDGSNQKKFADAVRYLSTPSGCSPSSLSSNPTSSSSSASSASPSSSSASGSLSCSSSSSRQYSDGKLSARRIVHSTLHMSVSHMSVAKNNLSKIFFGREKEVVNVEKRIRKASVGEGSILILEGDAGMGKSLLLSYGVSLCTDLGVKDCVAEGDSIEKETPYLIWQGIFNTLLDLHSRGSPEVKIVNLIESQPDATEWRQYLPLLNTALSLKFPDNELTEEHKHDSEWKKEHLHKLLVYLLRLEASKQPLLIVLDNAQWMDSASVSFTSFAISCLPSICFMLGMRPLYGRALTLNRQLLELENCDRVRLEPISNTSAEGLACSLLGCWELPSEIQKCIHKANGNPLFVKEITHQLRDRGAVTVVSSSCKITGDISSIQLPDNVQGLIMSRVDRLPPSQKLILKIASVIGNEFSLEAVIAIYPSEEDRDNLRGYMDKLVDSEILIHCRQQLEVEELEGSEVEGGTTGRGTEESTIRRRPPLQQILRSTTDLTHLTENATGGDFYMFRSSLISQACYNVMTFAQRQQFHRSYAEWIEKTFGGNNPQCIPALAHHWSKAAQAQGAEQYVLLKAMDYLLERATSAAACSATGEALKFIERAEAFGKQIEGNVPQKRECELLHRTFRKGNSSSSRGGSWLLTGQKRQQFLRGRGAANSTTPGMTGSGTGITTTGTGTGGGRSRSNTEEGKGGTILLVPTVAIRHRDGSEGELQVTGGGGSSGEEAVCRSPSGDLSSGGSVTPPSLPSLSSVAETSLPLEPSVVTS